MTYKETVEWMFQRLPMYQKVGVLAYKPDLSNVTELLQHLNHPEKHLKCIHVAGTNGKGSTCSMLASTLMECGYKVGLFTSPHLLDYRERIRINGQCVEEDFVISFIEKNKSYFEERSISFFEMTVGMALTYFSEKKVDFAIIEVGLGGRLDATNVITPLVSVITNIGFDHMNLLGNSLSAIATEKAGIIKSNIPVVIGEYREETRCVFVSKSKDNNAKVYWAADMKQKISDSDLKGGYQKANQKTVLTTIHVLREHYALDIPSEKIEKGFMHVGVNSGLKGRWQQISEKPKIILDTAHNAHGLTEVLKQISSNRYNNLYFILGFVNDKELNDILSLFPKNARYVFTQPKSLRALDFNVLVETAKEFGLYGKGSKTVESAYDLVMNEIGKEDFIYIGGSTFIVADFLEFFEKHL